MTQKLTPLQLELLRVYSFNPDEEDVLAIKKMLAIYFSKKLIHKIDRAIEEKGITEQELDFWLNE